MAALEDALALVRSHEGDAFVPGADESGGASKYGVTLRYLRELEDGDIDGDGDIDADDVRGLTWEEACAKVYIPMWYLHNYGNLPARVSAKVFDLAVNAGPSRAHKILQRACRAAGIEDLKDDGILGLETRRAVNCCNADSLVVALRSEAAGFYRSLVAGRASRAKWLSGWLNRAYS